MTQRSYRSLIRENKEFRRLWTAAVISMLGQWFNTIAVLAYPRIHGKRVSSGIVVHGSHGRFRRFTAAHRVVCRPVQS